MTRNIPMSLIKATLHDTSSVALSEELGMLINDIKEDGLKNAIEVYPVEGHYELVRAVHRLVACQLAGLKEVPCEVVHDPFPEIRPWNQ